MSHIRLLRQFMSLYFRSKQKEEISLVLTRSSPRRELLRSYRELLRGAVHQPGLYWPSPFYTGIALLLGGSGVKKSHKVIVWGCLMRKLFITRPALTGVPLTGVAYAGVALTREMKD